jgi:outer membrane immunogenic protein
MSRSTLVSAAALGIAMLPLGAAQAKDPIDWTGAYIGVHAGHLWGDVDIAEYGLEPTITGDVSGFVGGVLAGYNFPATAGPLIFGVEADWGWSNAEGTGDAAPDIFAYDVDWVAHLRAIGGVPMGNTLMPFAAIGLALADLDVAYESQIRGGVFTGLSLGAGIDVALGPNGVLRAEAIYDIYGNKDYAFESEPAGVDISARTELDAAIFELP